MMSAQCETRVVNVFRIDGLIIEPEWFTLKTSEKKPGDYLFHRVLLLLFFVTRQKGLIFHVEYTSK